MAQRQMNTRDSDDVHRMKPETTHLISSILTALDMAVDEIAPFLSTKPFSSFVSMGYCQCSGSDGGNCPAAKMVTTL